MYMGARFLFVTLSYFFRILANATMFRELQSKNPTPRADDLSSMTQTNMDEVIRASCAVWKDNL